MNLESYPANGCDPYNSAVTRKEMVLTLCLRAMDRASTPKTSQMREELETRAKQFMETLTPQQCEMLRKIGSAASDLIRNLTIS